jgi:hypothetical protein
MAQFYLSAYYRHIMRSVSLVGYKNVFWNNFRLKFYIWSSSASTCANRKQVDCIRDKTNYMGHIPYAFTLFIW